jgi:DNA-binding FadR family transcriptional regulator
VSRDKAEKGAPLGFAAPERQTLSRQVVSQLTEMIVSRRLPPGTPLPTEQQLADQLGVSRMVIRESVRIVAALGLVNVRHGVGTFVNPSHAWQIEGPLALLLRSEQQSLLRWLEVRTLIETAIVRLAASRATAENVEAMTAAVERMRQSGDDPERVVLADEDFHQEVALSTGNPLMVTLMRPILKPLREHLLAAVRLPERYDRSMAEHQAIISAIAARDAERAVELMTTHLTTVTDEIRALHGEQSPDPSPKS